MLSKKLAVAALLTLGSTSAMAETFLMPYLNSPIKAGRVEDLNDRFLTLFPAMERGDMTDMPSIDWNSPGVSSGDFERMAQVREDVVFYPWTKLVVVGNDLAPGTESLGFAYSRTGGLLSATLRASTDYEQLRKQTKSYAQSIGLRPEEIEVRPLQPTKGIVKATVTFNSGYQLAVGTNVVENANPTSNVAVSILMSKEMADLAMVAMHTGAAMGWNWQYEFIAGTVPFFARIDIDWRSVYEYTQTKLGLQSIVTKISLDKIVRKLKEDQVIRIRIAGGADYEKEESAIWEVVKIVLSKTFKANHPEPQGDFQELQLPRNNGGHSWLSNGNIPGQSWMNNFAFKNFFSGVTGAFSLKKIKSTELKSETIWLASAPYRSFTFSAGVQIGGLCNSHPQYFAYEDVDGTIRQGCASRTTPPRNVDASNMEPVPAVHEDPGTTTQDGGNQPPSQPPANDYCAISPQHPFCNQ